MLRPDAVAARGQDAVRVERVLDLLVDAPKDMVVEAVALHHRILERRRAAVLAPAVLRADADDLVDLLAQRAIAIRVLVDRQDRKSTRLNSSHVKNSYA